MENFNKTLKNYFAGQGLTQSDVAERLQISRTIANNDAPPITGRASLLE